MPTTPSCDSLFSGPPLKQRLPQVLRPDTGRRKSNTLSDVCSRTKAGGKEAAKAQVQQSARHRTDRVNQDRQLRKQETLNRSRTTTVGGGDDSALSSELGLLQLKLKGFRDQIIVIANSFKQRGDGEEDSSITSSQFSKQQAELILKQKDVRPFGGAAGIASPAQSVEEAIETLEKMTEVILTKVRGINSAASSPAPSHSVGVRPLPVVSCLLQFLTPVTIEVMRCSPLIASWPQLLVGILKVLQVLNLCALKRPLIDVPLTGDEPNLGLNPFDLKSLLEIVHLVNQANPGDPLARLQEPMVLLATCLPQLHGGLLDSRVNSSLTKQDLDGFCMDCAGAFSTAVFLVHRTVKPASETSASDIQQPTEHVLPLFASAFRGLETALNLWKLHMKQDEELLSGVVHLSEALVIGLQLLNSSNDTGTASNRLISGSSAISVKKSIVQILVLVVSSCSVNWTTLLMNAGLAPALSRFLSVACRERLDGGLIGSSTRTNFHIHERVLVHRFVQRLLQILTNLFYGPIQQIQQVLDANILPLILQELASFESTAALGLDKNSSSGDASAAIESLLEAVTCINGLVASGTVEQIQYFVQLGGLGSLIQLCTKAEDFIQLGGESSSTSSEGFSNFHNSDRYQCNFVFMEQCIGVAVEAMDCIFSRICIGTGSDGCCGEGEEKEEGETIITFPESTSADPWEVEIRRQFAQCDGRALFFKITTPLPPSSTKERHIGIPIRRMTRSLALDFLGMYFPSDYEEVTVRDVETALNQGMEHKLNISE